MHTLKGDLLIKQLGIDYFKQGSCFGALTDEAVRFLLERGEVIQLTKGERLYNIGDTEGCFYIIVKGAVQLSGHFRGEIQHAREFTFGEQMGFVGMISLEGQIGNADAAEESIVLKISSALFYDLHEQMPSDFGILMLNLSREMARRIRELFPRK